MRKPKRNGQETLKNEGTPPVQSLPSAMERLEEIATLLAGLSPAVFLDYDGTLTPIVSHPENAELPEETRRAVLDLADLCPVAVISGRDRAEVEKLVGLEGLFYAGSHGFDIALPGGREEIFEMGGECLPDLAAAEAELRERLSGVEGAQVERKKFAIAVHFRRVSPERVEEVAEAVAQVHGRHGRLRRTGGKKIFELLPAVDWDKGKAIAWLLEKLDLAGPLTLPIYIGDDETDEDVFRELRGRGLGILVIDKARPTAATYILKDPEEVARFLRRLAALLKERGG